MSALKLCPTCGAEYPANERFCPKDGSALKSQGGGTDLVGSILAERYHVIRKLGEGGMGQVYLAEHVKMGRMSAVKVMNPGMVHDADAISRFNREASNASRINHPHVAGIYDFGETSEGLIYLAMEFVEGEPLTDLVQRAGALTPARAAELARQSGEALAAAHDMGIVHRDLKPDNIMVTRSRDGSDCVKIVDFGIAKAANVEAQKVTRTGLVIGTPEYMSPEQLAGDPLDGRSDIYSLGLVTFNMLTGRLPFPSETVQESMIMRLTDQPKRLAEMRPEVSWPPAVQAVMDRALQRDSKDRYASAAEFGRDLLQAVTAMPSTEAAYGKTEVMGSHRESAPIPATRVSDAPSARVAPLAPAKSRGVLYAGLGAVVAAALVLGVTLTKGSDAPPPQTVSTGANPPPVATAGPAPATSGLTPGPGRLARERSADSVATVTKIRETSSAGQSSPGTEPDVEARLEVLLDESANEATAARSLREAAVLAPRATAAQRVGLRFVEAQALGMENDSTRACPILRDILAPSRGTKYHKKVQDLLELAC